MNNNNKSYDTDQHAWSDLKQKIKSKWSKLTDQDIDSMKGNMDLLKTKIQHTYGFAKDRAEKEFNEFQSSYRAQYQGQDQSRYNQASRRDQNPSENNGNRRSAQDDNRSYSQESNRPSSQKDESDEFTDRRDRDERPAKSA